VQLTAGLAATDSGLRNSEYVARYVLQLAEIHAAAGNRDVAAGLLEEARGIGLATGSAKLAAEAGQLARRLGL
jgi:hypothetical protein